MSRFLVKTGINRVPRGAACGMMRRALYGVESGVIGIPDVLDRHRGACLSCQASTVWQRQVIKGLTSLRQDWEPLPHDMATVLEKPLEAVLDAPAEATAKRPFKRAAVASASIVAIALVVLAGRRLRSQVG